MTLIELMIAMLIGSLLITLVFTIYTRMSVAYRTQTVLSQTQQTLRTAREVIAADVRQAGFMIPNGFFVKAKPAAFVDQTDPNFGTPGNVPIPPIMTDNDRAGADGTDAIRIYYADASARARVMDLGSDPANIPDATVDDIDQFKVGDVVVITAQLAPIPSTTQATDIAQFAVACVVEVTATQPAPAQLDFADNGGLYNSATNEHCGQLLDSAVNKDTVMAYRFAGRAYRIDSARGVLQRSPTGELAPDDFEDLGFGFTDLQLASRYFEDGDATDLDSDGEAARDWYSGDAQEVLDPARPAVGVVTQMTMSLVARTIRTLDVAGTPATPAFIDVARPDHNELGDRPSGTAAEGHLYRYSTTRIDVRNMGVGR